VKDPGVLAFSFDGVYGEVVIRLELQRRGLLREDDESMEKAPSPSSSSTLELPEKLPRNEEALKNLAALMEALKSSSLA